MKTFLNRLRAVWDILFTREFILIKINRRASGTMIQYRVRTDTDGTREDADLMLRIAADLENIN